MIHKIPIWDFCTRALGESQTARVDRGDEASASADEYTRREAKVEGMVEARRRDLLRDKERECEPDG